MTRATHRILIIEDDPALRSVLRMMLAREGFRLIEADTGASAEFEARRCGPDLLLMDLGLPDIDGLTAIRHVRDWSPVPIIVLSARTTEDQKIAAFDAGADDYVTKPFFVAEILARVRAVLDRSARGEDERSILNLGHVRIDLARRLSCAPQGDVNLTPLEYRVLECLSRRAGMVMRQHQLMSEIWGPDCVNDANGLRAFIKHLREKLEPDPSRPRYLVTEIGLGYRLCPDDAVQVDDPGEEGGNAEIFR